VASLATCTFSTRPATGAFSSKGGHIARHELEQARDVPAFDRGFQFLLRRLHRQAVAGQLGGRDKTLLRQLFAALEVIACALQRHARSVHALAGLRHRGLRAFHARQLFAPAALVEQRRQHRLQPCHHVTGLEFVAFLQRDAQQPPRQRRRHAVAVGQPRARVLVHRGLEGPRGCAGQFHRQRPRRKGPGHERQRQRASHRGGDEG